MVPEEHRRTARNHGQSSDSDDHSDMFDSDEQEQPLDHRELSQRPPTVRRVTFYSKSTGFNDQVELTNLARFGAMKTTCFSCSKRVKRSSQRSSELQCGHVHCIPCLERKFKQAVREPSAMPATCCTNEAIPLTLISICDLPRNFREDFTRKMVEYCRKRFPCPGDSCQSDVVLEQATYKRDPLGCIAISCPACQTQICADCKGVRHHATCLQDAGTRKLLSTLEAERSIQITDEDTKTDGPADKPSPGWRDGDCWHCGKVCPPGLFELARCGHDFCHTCLVGYFVVGLVMPQHSPPICCNVEIGLSCYSRILVNPWLNEAWLAQHEMAETGSWACPTGAHFPKNLYITSKVPAVWKPKVQCNDCGRGHGVYCIRCKDPWHKTQCLEFQKIEALEERLRDDLFDTELRRDLVVDQTFVDVLADGIAIERKLRDGEKLGPGQFRRATKFLDARCEPKQAAAHAVLAAVDDSSSTYSMESSQASLYS